MLNCCFDADYYITIPEQLETSQGTLICIECKKLIYPGTPYYRIEEYGIFDTDFHECDEVHQAYRPCCEECGDLAASFVALGYCWDYGDLRDDIRTMNEDY
ncbi:MAG TPA: hypothetical protein ENI81_07230 [Phycisphaerales bacterium]|nr:hypothetical protein [Phycisphaerales bacterium]